MTRFLTRFMKINPKVLGTLLCLLPLCSPAQSYWKLDFQGTSSRTNDAGKIVKGTITQDTLIKGCSQAVGGTNHNLALALHFRPDGLDTLEVVNPTNAEAFHCEILHFAFQQSYTNLDGTQVKTFAYVYTIGSDVFPDSGEESRGSAVISMSVTNSPHTGLKTNITGKIQFWLGSSDTNQPQDTIIASGTFNAIKALMLP
jgi:hypothetical protein